VLIELRRITRRCRLLLVVLALSGTLSTGVVGLHTAIDAGEIATVAEDHAEHCLLSLACVLGAVALLRFAGSVPPLGGRTRTRVRLFAAGLRRPLIVDVPRSAVAPRSRAELCRFQT
jgi:hypothetical protein